MGMEILCFDLEGVFIPEIWINVAERTGLESLRITTRDEPDYDKLMRYRLEILDEQGLGIAEIQQVISQMHPLPGAREFLDWAQKNFQVVILSDTFYQFAEPLMAQLGYPVLFCHNLDIDANGRITDYKLRMSNQKVEAVNAFIRLNFTVFASGDSYNDTGMLLTAHRGFLFKPPKNVIMDFPQLPVVVNYEELQAELVRASSRTID